GTDPENQALTFSAVGLPSHGIVGMNSAGTFTYTPTPDYTGPDLFTFKANDGTLDSQPATVSVTVNPLTAGNLSEFLNAQGGNLAIDLYTGNPALTVKASRTLPPKTVFAAVNGLPTSAFRKTVVVDLGGGTYTADTPVAPPLGT